MFALLNFTRYIDRVAERVGRLGSWLMLPLIFIIIFDVVTRKFQFIQQWIMASPLYDYMSPTKLQEMEWHLHAAVFLTAFGMTYLHNAHVRVDVLRENFTHRRQAMIELFGILLFALPYFLVVLYFSWEFVARAYISGEGSDALTGVPHRWVIKSFMLLGVLMITLTCISVVIKLAMYLFAPAKLAAAADEMLNVFPVTVDQHAEELPEGEVHDLHVKDPDQLDDNRSMP